MNRTNLKLLADWLIENADYLVETKAFDMKVYRGDMLEDGELDSSIPLPDGTSCGTVGCAIGWAPFSKIPELLPVKDDYTRYNYGLNFGDYCKRVMGLDGLLCECPIWVYFFDDDWAEYDNTPKGAAIRILYVLENGLPYDFEDYDDIGEGRVNTYMDWFSKRESDNETKG